MLMHNPPHPGKVIKRTLLDDSNLSVTEAAKALGAGRITLSRLINGHIGISPEMAVRLSLALNTSSEMWINMQATPNFCSLILLAIYYHLIKQIES